MTGKGLSVIEQREVTFYGDVLTAVWAEDGNVYVSIHNLCDAFGLDRHGQIRRIERNEILFEDYKGGDIMSSPSESGRGGGIHQVNLLRVDLIPPWLSGLDVSRAKEEIQAKLKHYQREAAKVLWEAFQAVRLTADFTLDELFAKDTPAA